VNKLSHKWLGISLVLAAAFVLTNACSLSPQPEPPVVANAGNLGGSTGGGPIGAGGHVPVDSSMDAGVEVVVPNAPGARAEDGGAPTELDRDAGSDAAR
jgi:hypothetical protein